MRSDLSNVPRPPRRRCAILVGVGTLGLLLGSTTAAPSAEPKPRAFRGQGSGSAVATPIDTDRDGIAAVSSEVTATSSRGTLTIRSLVELRPTGEPRTCPTGERGVEYRLVKAVIIVTVEGGDAFFVAPDNAAVCGLPGEGRVLAAISGPIRGGTGSLAQASGSLALTSRTDFLAGDRDGDSYGAVSVRFSGSLEEG